MDYQTYIESKIELAQPIGLADPSGLTLHPSTYPHQRDAIHWALRNGRGLIAMSFGLGKCHGAGTQLLMADGTLKNVEDIRVGDCLMGDDSLPRRVLSLARGREALYRITLKNGDTYTCNESHMLSLRVSNKYHQHRYGDVVNMSVREYLTLPDYVKHNCLKHYKVPVDFAARPVPFDPYLYGAWLGDGTANMLAWTINDRDQAIVERIQQFADALDLDVQERPARGCTTYALTRRVRGRALHCDEFYFVQSSSDEQGKHIDRRYLQNSREFRLELLAGLLDTDGYLIDNCYEIATKWAGLRDDILFLCRSLGLSVSHGIKVVDDVIYYRIYISGNVEAIPCVTRKKATARRQIKNPLVYGFCVEPLGVGDYYGFEIDGNHLYLLGDFTVAHNSHIQIEIARSLHEMTDQSFLLVCPLGVKHQFEHEDGPRLGVPWQYVRTDDELRAAETPYLITNYERVRDGDIDPRQHTLCGVSLDEGSVLRNLGSKTYQTFQDVFAHVPHRFVNTATPSPNRFRELIYYAQFLGVMDAGQALTRFFKRNPEKAGDLTLHPHHEKEFWLWVASWALFIYRPSDLGYSDDGYDVPELRVHYHRLNADHTRAWEQQDGRGQRRLLLDASSSATAAVKEKRATLSARVEEARSIIAANSDRHWLIWHHLEDERRAVEKSIPGTVAVYGSQDLELREQRILDFTHGQIPILATKPEIAGSGCNFQRHCYSNIFLGIDYKFEDFIQAIHRTQRFQQTQPVDVHIIYSESEDHVVEVLKRKWAAHDELTQRMQGIVKHYGLSHRALETDLKRTLGVERQAVTGQRFTAIHNDSVLELADMPANSVGLVHTSIPFGNHYEYTTQLEDFGHNESDADFWQQMDYLIPHLFRVLKPGRLAAIHVKDRILYSYQTASGFMEVEEFSDDTVKAFKRHGFLYEGRRTIVTDVVRENAGTYRLGWTEMVKDASKMGSGLPEYLLLFRKPPTESTDQYADDYIVKRKDEYSLGRWQIDAHSLWRSNGNRPLTPEEIALLEYPGDVFTAEQMSTPYDYERHVAINDALEARTRLPKSFMLIPPKVTRGEDDPVWDDVVAMRTLNSNQALTRERNHICPLPFDIVERVIRLYSNPDDVVLDCFAGLFTVPYTAIKMNRHGYGIELSGEYYTCGVRYCQQIEQQVLTPTLFDLLALEQGK